MANFIKIIPNVDNVGNAPNEYMSRFSVNGNTRKLLDNDIALQNTGSVVASGQTILDYVQGTEYSFGRLVWFRSTDGQLWLLRKINFKGTGSQNPQDAVNENPKNPDFQTYGWKNENKILDIEELGVDTTIKRRVNQSLQAHQNDEKLHKYGVLETQQDYNDKFLKKNLSNINPSREVIFFPYKTIPLEHNNVITSGYARVWDCGLIEYDFTYKFGYCGKDENGYDVLTCNNVEFQIYNNKDLQKYFFSSDDARIFYCQSDYSSTIGDTIQKNRNDFVNTYFAKITFPRLTFKDEGNERSIIMTDNDYMIFGSNVMTQDSDSNSRSVNTSTNQIAYCDKNIQGFTALLVTFPNSGHYGYSESGYNAKNGGLVYNSYHCHIVGRWTFRNE